MRASIDTGNALVKGVRNDQITVFPNMVAVDKNNILRTFKGFTSKDPLIVEFEGQRWAVGQSAADLTKSPNALVGYARYDSEDYRALIAGLLAEMFPTRGGEVALTFSLPVDAFRQVDAQIERLAGTWEIKARGRNLRFELPAELMTPIPEAFGSLCYFMLAEDGRDFIDVSLAEIRIAVIDVGGYTTDLLTFDELDLTPLYGTVEHGVIQVREEINKEIKHEFNRHDLAEKTIDQIMTPDVDYRHWYKHAGKPNDVTEIVEAAIFQLTRDVLEVWNNTLGGALDYDVVIFTGGGSPLIRPFLERKISHQNILRVPEKHAYLANAVGGFRYQAFVAD